MRDTERDRNTGRGRSSKREVLCEEPDAGLDPRTLGSHPEPKADAQPLSHPGVPIHRFRCLFGLLILKRDNLELRVEEYQLTFTQNSLLPNDLKSTLSLSQLLAGSCNSDQEGRK